MLYHVSYQDLRTLDAIRTRTVDDLNVVPLPLGYEGMSCERRIRTSIYPVQSRACCRLHQLALHEKHLRAAAGT